MTVTDGDGKPQRRRRHTGQYVVEQDTAERDAEIAKLINTGFSLREVGKRLGMHHANVDRAYKRVLDSIRVAPAEEARQRETERLQESLGRYALREEALYRMLAKQHITVQNGKVVYTDTGETIEDDEFALKIYDRIRDIEKLRDTAHGRLVALNGWTMPTTQQVSAEVTYVIKGLEDAG